MKKLSVITVSFNQGLYIEETINSVLSQDYPNLEYIVVDGGSTDNTLDILDRYKNRISVIISEPDCGPADALNKGFSRATGDYFSFLNSDDLYDSNMASLLIDQLIACESDLVYSDVRFINHDGARIFPYSFPLAYAVTVSPEKLLSRAAIIPQQGSIWSRRIHDYGIRFNPKNKTCWDLEFFVEALCAGFEFKPVERCLSSFRIHQNSITGESVLSKPSRKNTRDHLRISDHSRINSILMGYGYNCNSLLARGLKFDNFLKRSNRYIKASLLDLGLLV